MQNATFKPGLRDELLDYFVSMVLVRSSPNAFVPRRRRILLSTEDGPKDPFRTRGRMRSPPVTDKKLNIWSNCFEEILTSQSPSVHVLPTTPGVGVSDSRIA